MTKIEGANMSKPHTRCRLGKKRGHKGVWAGPLAIGRRAVPWFPCTARTAQRSRSGALALMVPPNGESLKIYVRSRHSVSIRAMRSGRQFIGCEFCARVASSSSTRVSRRIVQVGPPSADTDHNPHPRQPAAGAIARSVRARLQGHCRRPALKNPHQTAVGQQLSLLKGNPWRGRKAYTASI
jgi:hypothetical protein